MVPQIRLLSLVCLSGTVAACSSSSNVDLLIDLRTDLQPGFEFTEVRTELFEQIPTSSDRANDSRLRVRSAEPNELYGRGERIAVFSGLKPGRHVVRVRLLDTQGAAFLQRIVLLTVRKTSVFTVVMTRDCRGVVCPGPDDDPSAIACLGGRCGNPGCTPETPEFCPSGVCSVDVTCVVAAACAQALCTDEGTCLRVGQNGACPIGQWCNPDLGCVPVETLMDGGIEGLDGSLADGAGGDSGAPPVPLGIWQQALGGGSLEAGVGLFVDPRGAVLLSGVLGSTVDFGGGAAGRGAFVVEYSAEGAYRWHRTFGGTVSDQVRAVVRASNGSTFLVGDFTSSTIDFGGGPFTLSGTSDAFVVSLGDGGAYQWGTKIGGLGAEDGLGVAVDSRNNLTAVGTFTQTVDFGIDVLSSSGSDDIFVVSYSHDGNPLWVKRGGQGQRDKAHGVAVDGGDNVYVTGQYLGTLDFGGSPVVSQGFTHDMFLAKFDPSGNVLWVRSLGDTTGVTIGLAVTADAAGNATVTGSFSGTIDLGSGPVTAAGWVDAFVASFDAGGTLLWGKAFGDVNQDVGNAIAVDGEGNVAVSGEFDGTVDWGAGPVSSQGGGDFFIVSYGPTGDFRWSDTWGDAGKQSGLAMAFDEVGNVAVSAVFEGTVDIGSGPISSQGFDDVLLLTYGPDGSR